MQNGEFLSGAYTTGFISKMLAARGEH